MSETTNQQLILSPDNVPVLSKQNAATFHNQVKTRIYETGEDPFRYIETIKFFAALDKEINGDSATKKLPDYEFIDHVREQIKLNADKDTFTTPRGVKFQTAEVGTSYDFSNCGDSVLKELEEQEAEIKEKVKQRKEFLKTVSVEGLQILNGDELLTLFPPTKTSKSSFKTTLPK
jgi:hypothetical protein